MLLVLVLASLWFCGCLLWFSCFDLDDCACDFEISCVRFVMILLFLLLFLLFAFVFLLCLFGFGFVRWCFGWICFGLCVLVVWVFASGGLVVCVDLCLFSLSL